jgi:chorismate mutase / prephenate dehydratase
MAVDDSLKALRARIDAIDDSLLKLLSERAQIAQEVGRTKRGEKIYRPEREAEIIRRLRQANPGPLSGDSVERLIREVMSACRALEQDIRVSYLGPQGTFSQAAVTKHFGHEISAQAEADIDACFRAVETGRADFAVVPVENSSEGAISRTLDLIVSSPLKICGEVMLPIHQNLMRLPPSTASPTLSRKGERGQTLGPHRSNASTATPSRWRSARTGSPAICRRPSVSAW